MTKLSFHGGVGTVTGANHLLETDQAKLLVDCGLFQGPKTAEDRNRDPFPYNPSEIDILFITHGHLDHIGRIPKLVRDGFKGRIISTPPTRDFAELMLIDSLGILTKEAHQEKKEPIYSEIDVKKAMELWETVEYDQKLEIKNVEIIFRDAGHILGSAMLEMIINSRRVVFSGDLGNPPVPLLNRPYKITDADYLIIESTYGDREHEDRKERKIKIERAIEKAVKNKGVLMIPAFSIERTQQLLFELNDLVENGKIPRIPIFLDSPLAINVTEVYKKYESYFNKQTKDIIKSGDDIFKFPGLEFTLRTEESKKINDVPAPKIIIAGSGMSTGGRIIHHEKHYLPDPNSILLLVGFQSAGSLGRRLLEGDNPVKILGSEVIVNAEIESVTGYSAHPDINGLFDFVENASTGSARSRRVNLKKVFVVQGEPKASLFFTQRIRDYLGIEAVAPEIGDSFDIDI